MNKNKISINTMELFMNDEPISNVIGKRVIEKTNKVLGSNL